MEASVEHQSHEDVLSAHMEIVRTTMEQSLHTIVHQMQQFAQDLSRLAAQDLEQWRKESEKMRSMGGTGEAPTLNTAVKGYAWVEPVQPARPVAYDDMKICLPSDTAPLIDMNHQQGFDMQHEMGFRPQQSEDTLREHVNSHLRMQPTNQQASSLRFRAVDSEVEPVEEDYELRVTRYGSEDFHNARKSSRMQETASIRAACWKEANSSDSATRKISSGQGRQSRKVDGVLHEPKAVFADASAMKEKVRAAVMVKEYNVADFYFKEGFFQAVARNQLFEYTTLFVIAFNALWISIDADNNDSLTLKDAPPIFQVAEHTFCVYFTGEIIIRFLSFELKYNCLTDAWFCFDSVLVTIMIAETWLMNLVIAFTAPDSDGSSGGALGNTSVLKLFRLVRLTRMARMAKLLRAIPELIILIKGMWVASRSVAFTLMLLTIILYFFAIVFRQLTDDSALGDESFSSVPGSMGTLLLDGVLPDQSYIIRQCFEAHWGLGILILLFVLLATLTVMNMLVGVLCEVVSVVSSVEKEELTVNYVKTRLMTLFKGADADNSTTICREEFVDLLTKKEAAMIIREVGVDVVGLVDFADFIFEEQKELTFGAFMELVLSLRGTNHATVKDNIDLRKILMQNMKAELSKVRTQILEQIHGINLSPTFNSSHGNRSISNGVQGKLVVASPNSNAQHLNTVKEAARMYENQQQSSPMMPWHTPQVSGQRPQSVPVSMQRPHSGPSTATTQERQLARYAPSTPPRAQSANARMRAGGPPPPLPNIPKTLPVEELEIIGSDGYLSDDQKLQKRPVDGTLRVGTVSHRGQVK